MKIFHLEANGRTNTGEYVRNVTDAIETTQGNEIAVFTSSNSFHCEKAISVFKNYAGSKGLMKLLFYFIGWFRLSFYLKSVKNESVFHVHWLRFSPIDYLFLKRIRRNKFVHLTFTVHNILPHEPIFCDRKLYSKIYSLFDNLIFHSNQNILDFNKVFPENRISKSIVPHYGYNVIPQIPKNEGAVKLLFFGSIRPYKGLELLISALKEMSTSIEWELVIAGKPEYDISSVRGMLEQDKYLKTRIKWKSGWIEDEDIPLLFQRSHVVVLPYLKIDNSGLVHLAMSYGKTVIVPRIGVFKDLIEDGCNGYFFECNSSESLAQKLELAFEEGNYKRIGEAASLKMDGHSLENIGKMLLNIYQQVN